MKVSIIGAGNVATQLALALRRAGHTIVQIGNRSNDAGQELAKTVGATFTANLRDLEAADVYLVAVKDDAIADVSSQLQLDGKVVAHTSGTKTKDILSFTSSDFGVFYPLQTMTKFAKVDFSGIPILIEGSNEMALTKLELLARSVSQNIHRVDEQQRQWVHIAAVFANNFTNHMYVVAEKLLLDHNLPFTILQPLIQRSIENLNKFSPSELQTGPATRGDSLTIEKHIELLADDTRLQKIYEILTQSIMASSFNLTHNKNTDK